METKTGIVTMIFDDRLFGFIRDESGEEYYFHQRGLIKPRTITEVRAGEPVEFFLVEDRKKNKPRAIGVVVT